MAAIGPDATGTGAHFHRKCVWALGRLSAAGKRRDDAASHDLYDNYDGMLLTAASNKKRSFEMKKNVYCWKSFYNYFLL